MPTLVIMRLVCWLLKPDRIIYFIPECMYQHSGHRCIIHTKKYKIATTEISRSLSLSLSIPSTIDLLHSKNHQHQQQNSFEMKIFSFFFYTLICTIFVVCNVRLANNVGIDDDLISAQLPRFNRTASDCIWNKKILFCD